MVSATNCANCGSALAPDRHGDNQYCEACTANWTRGIAAATQPTSESSIDPAAVARVCADCGAASPPHQSADHEYCTKCAQAWHRGNGSQQRPTS
jgi:predicted RNA-binding Zn-ribbon protein involved in translation (DUF1610 family)